MTAKVLDLVLPEKPVDRIAFWCPGNPVGKGDHTPFQRKDGSLGVRDREAAKGGKYRDRLTLYAETAMKGRGPYQLGVRVTLVVLVLRAKDHFYTGKRAGELKPNAPLVPYMRGTDLDKVHRRIGDSLQGICWVNDRQIVKWTSVRRYGTKEGLMLTVEPEPGA